ncbi:hypothetical protein [Turneriella parva]|uniref:Transmembrane protein n=1 Tax=Turneriella parva (strain ATCC BAA-1111 / DSM 21527 / NCTC 11395 / H) TaxID=869212 RepID=I4BAN3_TURPD|nr:hypothetical protein [Turneriella parva]AFM14340.1 hypothetical protein Turpa_3706 [Turneriella parva DSM 21527]
MPARRVRYSTLLWPALYSPAKILALCLAAMLAALALTYAAHSLTQPDQALYTRASERARAALQMKLAGVDSWRWQQNFACLQMPDDCLKILLRFNQSEVKPAQHRLMLEAPKPCAICHLAELSHKAEVVAVFPELPAREAVWWPAITTFILSCACLLFCGLRFAAARRQGQNAGSCVAALKLLPGAPVEARKWLKKQLRSLLSASYVEREELRLRWISPPEKFALWLESERQALTKFAAHLRLVAVHGSASEAAAIPIEMLRIVYRFLTLPSAAPRLIDEKLFTNKEEKIINMRRLVAKNKSGASLRFVVWESD